MSTPASHADFTIFDTYSDVLVVFLLLILLINSQTMSLSLSRLRVTQKALELPFFLFLFPVAVFGRTGKSYFVYFSSFAAIDTCDQDRAS